MRIVCPSCDAAYDVPESVLTTRTLLRCSRCASDFSPPGLPQAPAPAAPEQTDHAPAEPEIPIESPPPMAPVSASLPAAEHQVAAMPQQATVLESRRTQILAAWAGSLMIIIAAIWLGISHRRSVMHAWPPSIRFYEVFGANPP
jgi:predicted Zn finger-like uncharacterized protein